MTPPNPATIEADTPLRIGLLCVSDRAASGAYEDQGLPSLRAALGRCVASPWQATERLIPDERELIERSLIELIDTHRCHWVLTTGGTGPARRDVTPEATEAVATRLLPGFGEHMRRISLAFVPTAILSRQVGALREIDGHAALILNLPGRPKAIGETLEGVRADDGRVLVPGILAAVPYCLDLIGAPALHTHEHIVKAFRPKSS